MKTHYSLLKISQGSSAKEIKTAYRRLARIYHPDTGGDHTAFLEIRTAYETLIDPERRKPYDLKLSRTPFKGEPFRRIVPVLKSGPVDVFDDLVDVLSRRLGLDRKSKIDVDIPISPKESRNGINIELNIPREIICHRCFGFGGTVFSTCGECHGKGMIEGTGKSRLTIKPGIRNNDKLVFRDGNYIINATILVS